jgi:hypothetical protein
MPTSFKIILTGGLLILIGLYLGIGDLRLKMSGRRISAQITEVSPTNNGRLQVYYVFIDETSSERNGNCLRDGNWVPPEDLKLPVVYLPGRPETVRAADDIGLNGLWVLLAGAGVTALGFWYFNRESVVEAHAQTAQDIEDASDPTRRIKKALRIPRDL